MISDTGGKHMDLVKIGKYIAGKRKDLGMTQKQLAEKLGMGSGSAGNSAGRNAPHGGVHL